MLQPAGCWGASSCTHDSCCVVLSHSLQWLQPWLASRAHGTSGWSSGDPVCCLLQAMPSTCCPLASGFAGIVTTRRTHVRLDALLLSAQDLWPVRLCIKLQREEPVLNATQHAYTHCLIAPPEYTCNRCCRGVGRPHLTRPGPRRRCRLWACDPSARAGHTANPAARPGGRPPPSRCHSTAQDESSTAPCRRAVQPVHAVVLHLQPGLEGGRRRLVATALHRTRAQH